MADYGTSDTSTTSLGANQFPISDVYVPNTGLRATEGGPASTDLGGKASAPTSMYVKDGGNVVEGSTTDTAVTGDTGGTHSAKLRGLSKIWADVWDSVNHRLHVNVDAGSITANAGTNLNTSGLAVESGGNLASAKADLDTIVTNTNKIPASPATEGGNLASILTQVTNHAVTQGAGAAAGTSWRISSDFQEIAGQAAGSVTSTSTDLIPSTDMSAYSFAILQLSGTWTMTLQAQWSNDNFATAPVASETVTIGASSANTTITANGMYTIPKSGRYLRIRPSVWTSNASCVGTLECYTQISPQLLSSVFANQTGTWTIQPGNTPNTTPWLVSAGPPADLTLLASAARTTTQTLADQANFAGKGLRVVLDVTTAGTGSITLTINAKDVASGKYSLLLSGAAVTTNSTNVYVIHPELTATANSIAKDVLPHTWQVVVTVNNSNSMTYSVGASYLS